VISDVRWSVLPVREEVKQMDLYVNTNRIERHGNSYIAEATTSYDCLAFPAKPPTPCPARH
jgi:hypothetical protein